MVHEVKSLRGYGRRSRVGGLDVVKIVGGHFLFTCSDTCCSMYRLTIMHSLTGRRTYGQTDDIIMQLADHTACSAIG